MAVGTNYYIRVLLSAFVYPADMPRQWCAHLWGCLWGIGGCYPSRTPSLVLAPGWWPGGLIPYLKGCWIPNTGASSRTGTGADPGATAWGHSPLVLCLPPRSCLNHRPLGHRADKGSVASNRHHQRGHTALPALSCRPYSGRLGKAGLAGRGVVFEAPRACLGHRPSRLCGATVLSQPPAVPLNLTPTHTPCIPLLALLRH